MQGRFLIIAAFVLATCEIAGCGGDPATSLQAPDQLQLYSIDGRDFAPGKEPKAEETFYGYPVLGKLDITDTKQRQQLVAALKDGIIQGKAKRMAKCFWPRHGIRAVEKGQTIEYVICFECSRFTEFLGGERVRHEPISPNVQPTFDKMLEEAGIPLAPK